MSTRSRNTLIALVAAMLLLIAGILLFSDSEQSPTPAAGAKTTSAKEQSLEDESKRTHNSVNAATNKERTKPDAPEAEALNGESDKKLYTLRVQFKVVIDGEERPQYLDKITKVSAYDDTGNHENALTHQGEGLFISAPFANPKLEDASLSYTFMGDDEYLMGSETSVTLREDRVVDYGTVTIDASSDVWDDVFIHGQFTHPSGYQLSKLALGRLPVEVTLNGKEPVGWIYTWDNTRGVAIDEQGRFSFRLPRSHYESDAPALRDDEIRKLEIRALGGGEVLTFKKQDGKIFDFGSGVLSGGILEVEVEISLQAPLVWRDQWDGGESTHPIWAGKDDERVQLRSQGLDKSFWDYADYQGNGIYRAAQHLPCEAFNIECEVSTFWGLGKTFEPEEPIELFDGEVRKLRFSALSPKRWVALIENNARFSYTAYKIGNFDDVDATLLEKVTSYRNFRQRLKGHTQVYSSVEHFFVAEASKPVLIAASEDFQPQFEVIDFVKPSITRIKLSKPWPKKEEVEDVKELGSLKIKVDANGFALAAGRYQLKGYSKRTDWSEDVEIKQSGDVIATLENYEVGDELEFLLYDRYATGGFAIGPISMESKATIVAGESEATLKIKAAPAFPPPTGDEFHVQGVCDGKPIALLWGYPLEGKTINIAELDDWYWYPKHIVRTGSNSYEIRVEPTSHVAIPAEWITRFGDLLLRGSTSRTEIKKSGVYSVVSIDDGSRRYDGTAELSVNMKEQRVTLWSGYPQSGVVFELGAPPTVVEVTGETGNLRWYLAPDGDETRERELDLTQLKAMAAGSYSLRARHGGVYLALRQTIEIPSQRLFQIELPSVEEFLPKGEIHFSLNPEMKKRLLKEELKVGLTNTIVGRDTLEERSSDYYLRNVGGDLPMKIVGDSLVVSEVPLNTPLWLQVSIGSFQRNHWVSLPQQVTVAKAGPVGALHMALPRLVNCFGYPDYPHLSRKQRDAGLLDLNDDDEDVISEIWVDGKELPNGAGVEIGKTHQLRLFIKGKSQSERVLTLEFTPTATSLGWQDGVIDRLQELIKQLPDFTPIVYD